MHLQALLNYGAGIDTTGQQGWTPLHLATRYGHTKTVKVRIKYVVSRVLDSVCSKTLLNYGANANVVKKDQWTPLHQAAQLNYTGIVKVHPNDVLWTLSRREGPFLGAS